jgi:hypothetical protein
LDGEAPAAPRFPTNPRLARSRVIQRTIDATDEIVKSIRSIGKPLRRMKREPSAIDELRHK